VHVRADGFAFQYTAQVAEHIHIEDIDGEMILAAHGGRRDVHHFQSTLQHFVVSDFVEFRSRGIFLRIGRVNPVDAGAFEHDIGFDLDAAQRRTGVGGEIGVARSGTHDDHLPAFERFDGLPFGVKFADRFHADGREHAVGHPLCAERRGECKAVDDGGAHAHLVAFHAIESLAGAAESAKDVATSDDDANLHAHVADFANLGGIFVETLGVDAVSLGTHEAFAAEFEENAFEFHMMNG